MTKTQALRSQHALQRGVRSRKSVKVIRKFPEMVAKAVAKEAMTFSPVTP